MPVFIAGKLERDGITVVESLKVQISERSVAGGLKSWNGYFDSTLANHPRPGESFQLVLSDGRSGTILIKRVNIGSGRKVIHVYFVGSGSLK